MTMSTQWLRQSTASQVRQFGPFLDLNLAPQNGLTIAAADVKFRRHTGSSLVPKNSGGLTSLGANGLYHGTLDATDSQTAGILDCSILVAPAVVVTKSFFVLPANLYDSLLLGTDMLQVDMQQLIGSAAHATRLRDGASAVKQFTVVSDAGNGVGTCKTDLTETDNDFWKGAQIIFLTGALAFQRSAVSVYNGTTKFLTYGNMTGTPSGGDTGILV